MNVAIVGGSLTGLAAANVFHRLGISVTVYEKFSQPLHDRGSSLGFVDVQLWEYLRGQRMTRMGAQAHRSQGAYYYGDLWRFLYEGLPEDCVKFNHVIHDLGVDPMKPTINDQVYDAVIVADGGFSSLRKYVTGNDKQPEYAGHLIYRAKLALEDYPGVFRGEGAYNADKCFAIALNVAQNDGHKFIMGGVAVGAPESDVKRPLPGASRHAEPTTTAASTELPDWFMPYVRRCFANHANGQVVKWLELCLSKGKITPQPLFEYMADKVVKGRIMLMGDAAHMASPRTAAGAHTGILDAAGLLDAFSKYPGKENIDQAIRAYEPGGLQRARDLYLRSKEVSRPLVYRPGDAIDEARRKYGVEL